MVVVLPWSIADYGATAERMMDLARCVFERGGERYRVPTYVKKFAADKMIFFTVWKDLAVASMTSCMTSNYCVHPL